MKQLLPTVPGLDYAVNTMSYQPGAALALVEIHVMEHGLLMLEGGGIYRLGELLVSGAGRRFYLDGALLPAVVWRSGQDPGKVSDLQRLESPPASRTVNMQTTQLHIDRDRLLADLETLASFSDDTPPGISRLVFADADQKSRAWLKAQCRDAGLTVREDAVGNMFARWAGARPELRSHRHRLPYRRHSPLRQI